MKVGCLLYVTHKLSLLIIDYTMKFSRILYTDGEVKVKREVLTEEVLTI